MRQQEIAAIYVAAVVQGIILVTFPAVSAIFTSAAAYHLSTTEYGSMFVPQAVTAILASLLGAGLTRHLGGKRVLLLGLAADLASMALLFVSQYAIGSSLAYILLLAATACLGVGFGFVVPALNTFTAAFFPGKVDRAILILNSLLGLGTALAPIFAALFVGGGIWWGLPILMSVLALALLVFTLRLPLKDGAGPAADPGHPLPKAAIPARFWIYAAFALVYGVCETMNANWATVYLSNGLGASATLASLALTFFWGAVTAGRVLFAAIEKWCPPRWTYRALPIVLAFSFVATACIPTAHPALALFSYALAGLGCSALLPLVISFAQEELTTMTSAVAGGMIGFYQMGYGLAAFGVGPIQTSIHAGLAPIYGGTSLIALALTALAFLIVGRRKSLTA
jgi:fucose permease